MEAFFTEAAGLNYHGSDPDVWGIRPLMAITIPISIPRHFRSSRLSRRGLKPGQGSFAGKCDQSCIDSHLRTRGCFHCQPTEEQDALPR